MDFNPGSPIWTQLVTEFSRRIVTNQWPRASRIPSVRELAADLGVNPNTIQRALAELERIELCYSERTTGRFVTTDTDRIDQLRVELTQEAADTYIARAKGFAMTAQHAAELINERWHLDTTEPPEATPSRTPTE
nr:GntR family transcriptional regulator [Pseudoclavibacter sp. Marseille-Q3772]